MKLASELLWMGQPIAEMTKEQLLDVVVQLAAKSESDFRFREKEREWWRKFREERAAR